MSDSLSISYHGRAWGLFWLTLRCLGLTVITLGIYRFWMRSRLRRYYWSAIQPGGMPLEYSGTGLEKLLGFLIAVVVLAIYLGIVNIGLSFVGLAFFQGHPAALNLSILAALPLYFFARYRARRYLLSRTTWRGLRFGAEPAAWRYSGVALLYGFLTVITVGLMAPLMTYKLEKFVTDRTWYGDLKFHQGGKWTMLFRPWLVVLGSFVIFAGAFIIAAQSGEPWAFGLILAAFVGIVVALVYFGVASFRILAAHKTLGQHVRFASTIRTGRMMRVYLLGGLIIGVAIIAVSAGMVALGVAVFAAMGYSPGEIGSILQQSQAGPQSLVAIGFTLVTYVVVLLVMSALSQVLFIQPILRHYAEELTILHPGELAAASQRPHDAATEAGGFADALDVGAAI